VTLTTFPLVVSSAHGRPGAFLDPTRGPQSAVQRRADDIQVPFTFWQVAVLFSFRPHSCQLWCENDFDKRTTEPDCITEAVLYTFEAVSVFYTMVVHAVIIAAAVYAPICP